MTKRTYGRKASGGYSRLNSPLTAQRSTQRRGIALLAVLVFVALLLPLVTLVLTSISTEQVATAEAIKGAKAEMGAEKATNDAISLVVQEKTYPNYHTSVAQPNTAIVVLDPQTGYDRDVVPDGSTPGVGADGQLGTGDDYWIGPRFDRSHIGTADAETNPRMYRWDFRFNNMHAPTYLGQSWSFSTRYLPYARSPFMGGTDNWIWLFNQYAAVEIDDDGDGVDDGYPVADPFDGVDGFVYGPGYYSGSDEPRDGVGVNRALDGSNAIEDYLYNAKVNMYESIYSDLDRGPIPTSLLKSYADVSDEASRINLNIFVKKVRVYMPESAETDYDEEGYGTNDFNLNGVVDEDGWKWMDNPLFPDRNTTLKWDYDFNANDWVAGPDMIDWGGVDIYSGTFTSNTDGVAMPEIGESVQHYYEGDTDGDGIPQSIEACRRSMEMLTSLPGVTPQLAFEILTMLNPPHDARDSLNNPETDPWQPWNANSPVYPTLHADLNGPATLGYPYSSTGTLRSDPTVGYPDRRVDACNITPPLVALDISFTGGVVDDYHWAFDFNTEDDLPLPSPRPLSNLDQLLDLPSMSERQFDRMKDLVTIFSYDTNVIANYVQDVGPTADLVNAYVPGDPEYTGSAVLRQVPEEMRDTDDLADLRYDIGSAVSGITLADYRDSAGEMFAHIREHLPRTLKDKITLPAVDRMGRAGSEDHLVANDDPRYDVSDPTSPSMLIPHRDDDDNVNGSGFSRPYNVGNLGHEFDWDSGGATYPGAGYPALNPSFSLDSCLSILMYRNGTFFEEDDYSYNPDAGAWRPASNRGLGSFFPFGAPWLLRIFGPFAGIIADLFESHNNPYSFLGENVNPTVAPHGPGVYSYETLVNAGSFDSVADVLDVPLYTFGRMNVGLMADPPSDFRYNLDSSNNDVDLGIPEELSSVNYYATFSDVVDMGWYLENISPGGPDGDVGTAADNPPMDVPLYYLYFTVGNRPGLTWDPNSANLTAVIPLTAMQLRAVGAGPEGSGTKITITAYDNFNNLDALSYRFTDSANFSSYVANGMGWNGTTGGAGSLSRRYGWDDVPEPEDPPLSDGDGRPLEPGFWNSAVGDDEPTYPGPQFNNAAERQAWAFDSSGDPYLTARIEARKWDPSAPDVSDPAAEFYPNQRSDEVCQVYLQFNEAADVPFRVDTLPVRVSGDQFEVRSSYGGAETNGGTYLLYDWDYSGVPDSYDGTWPPQGWQTGDPRVIRITPDAGNVTLRLYDLRVFSDDMGGAPYLPLPPGDFSNPRTFGPPVVGPGSNFVEPPPIFPASVVYGGVYPVVGTPGYAVDNTTVQLINTSPIVVPQIAAEQPSVWSNETQARFFASAAGGSMPYTYRVRIFDGADVVNIGTPPSWSGNANQWWSLNPNPSHDPTQLAPHAGVPIAIQTRASNDIREVFAFDPVGLGLGSGEFWAEVEVTDDAGTQSWAYTVFRVGTDISPGGSSGIPPNMNSSINFRTLGENRKGFVCSVAVDGGAGGYNYRWEVHRPLYNASSNNVIIGTEVVDSNAPYVSIDATGFTSGTPFSTEMVSNEPNPTFEFNTQDRYNNSTYTMGPDGIPDADGVYFVHCYAFDRADSSPLLGNATVAHDVAMVTISDTGVGFGGTPSVSGLARTPMSVLHAYPPGNTNAQIGDNPRGAAGNQPHIGSVTTASALDPDIAGNGDVIIIRGFNFTAPAAIPGPHPIGVASDNEVMFGGGVSADAIDVQDDGVSLNIGGVVYQQIRLSVRVPDGARSGYVTVTSSEGTSQRVFFQTGFIVTFDLIGKLSPNDPTYLNFELDFQGDGNIDYNFNTMANPSAEGQVRGADRGITHDFATEGIGNHAAALYVTDLISGRRAVSHQLIAIRDLNPATRRALVITSGMVTNVPPDPAIINPGTTIRDSVATFLVSGVLPGDEIQNTTLGQTAAVLEVYNNNELRLGPLNGAGVWGVGHNYIIRRWIDHDEDDGATGMLVNIWPEIDLRSETFTADPGSGVSFGSALGGVGGSGLYRKWQVDLNSLQTGGGGGSTALGNGTATTEDVSGDHLIDAAADFIALGVAEGDLVVLEELDDNGAPPPPMGTADVFRVDNANQLTLDDPTTPPAQDGLHGGSTITRIGTVTNAILESPPANPNPRYVIEQAGYYFVGDGPGLVYGVNMGGLLGFADAAPTPDLIINPAQPGVIWEVFETSADDPALNFDQIRVRYVGGAGLINALAGVVTPMNTPPAPAAYTQTVQVLNPATLVPLVVSPSWVGHTVTNNSAGGQTWIIIGVSVVNSTLTLADATRTNSAVVVGDDLDIDVPPAWVVGDTWRCDLPANQWRIGFDYSINSSETGSFVSSWSDASYASMVGGLSAPIDFTVNMVYPYDLDSTPGNPTLVQLDWNGDFIIDEVRAVGDTTRLDGATNGMDLESLTVTHQFTSAEVPPIVTQGVPTSAQYYVVATERGVPLPATFGPYSLPVVLVGGDDYDLDLSTLNVAGWDRDSWHRVTAEICYSESTVLMPNPLPNSTNFLYRWYYAGDQMIVPPGMQDYADTMATWTSYSRPFVTANSTGATSMRHQAVHGTGGALNWVSDANADTTWGASSYESPLGSNPVNYHEFIFQNGPNLMSVPGAGPGAGASFPAAVTGVGRLEPSGSFAYYHANRGVYNGFGFTTDNLAPLERAFSFDSQTFFWGDRLQGSDTERRPLAADFELDPLVGSNSQFVRLTSYVTGGDASIPIYTYRWILEKRTSIAGGYTGFVGIDGPWNGFQSSDVMSPIFDPVRDVADEFGGSDDGSGIYRVYLQVDDGPGGDLPYTTCWREFEIVTPVLSINVMASPPSSSTGSEIQYFVFIDGGRPPYDVRFDFDSNVNPGWDRTLRVEQGNEGVVSTTFSQSRTIINNGSGYICNVEVTDSAPAPATDTDVTEVEIAETIPLNGSLIVMPGSGVAPFLASVHYAVSGGREISGGGYNVTVQLVNYDGDAQNAVTRTEANTFGANGILDDPRLPSSDDDPVLLVVPEPGNYMVQLLVSDNEGMVVTRSEDIFASGYLMPIEYGNDAPQVMRDGENRPMHAVRVWVDPYLNIGDDGSTNNYVNIWDDNTNLAGGRMMEADLQVIGELFTTDPNPSFRSNGIFATRDPLAQPAYYANYTLSDTGEDLVQDFYDTFTIGRVNINTASEDVLASLFRRIIKQRAYLDPNVDLDLDDDGVDETYRVVRDPENDVYLSEAEARDLARKVIRYRTAYYDLHKPEAPEADGEFGYIQADDGGSYPEFGGTFRVDHLPVIGPFDGTNPHEYSISERGIDLRDPDLSSSDDINNAWDHMAASYYNFDPSEYMFYAPTDVAVVRERWEADVNYTLEVTPGNWQVFQFNYVEPASNYAKYLNDVVTNEYWESNRASEMTDWAGSGLYQVDTDNYSRWAFDARNYFTYSGGEYDVDIRVNNAGVVTSFAINPVPGTFGAVDDARNEIAIIESNGITAHTYISNPPFRSIFDLCKVIDDTQNPGSYPLDNTGGNYTMELDDDNFAGQAGGTGWSDMHTQVYSGPSVFRYETYWDNESCEFVPYANYLDDIAPYVTCRSYTFRVTGNGAVTASGGSAGAMMDTARISRDRSKETVVDIGPLWARRDTPLLNDVHQGAGLSSPDRNMSYRILWYRDE